MVYRECFFKTISSRNKNNEFSTDSVTFDPGARTNWHGTSADSKMVHIAITNFKEDTQVTWLEPVTSEQYTSAN